MNQIHRWTLVVLICAPLSVAQLHVITDLPDYADIAQQIGGDRVRVQSLAVPHRDPHFQEPKPSYVVKLNRASLLIDNGLGLTSAWLSPLLEQARNIRIMPGGPGYVFAGEGLTLLDLPERKTTRFEGDIHADGNPHYGIDPHNGPTIARNICHGLARVDPDGADTYRRGLDRFLSRCAECLARWDAALKPTSGEKIVMYHTTFRYLSRSFGWVEVGTVEPKPGVAPSASHLATLAERIQAEHVRVILHSPWESNKSVQLLAEKTRAVPVCLYTAVGASPQVGNWFDLWEHNVQVLQSAFAGGTNASAD